MSSICSLTQEIVQLFRLSTHKGVFVSVCVYPLPAVSRCFTRWDLILITYSGIYLNFNRIIQLHHPYPTCSTQLQHFYTTECVQVKTFGKCNALLKSADLLTCFRNTFYSHVVQVWLTDASSPVKTNSPNIMCLWRKQRAMMYCCHVCYRYCVHMACRGQQQRSLWLRNSHWPLHRALICSSSVE